MFLFLNAMYNDYFLINEKESNSSEAVLLRAWFLDRHHQELVRNANSPLLSLQKLNQKLWSGAQSLSFHQPSNGAQWSLRTTAVTIDLNATDKWSMTTNHQAYSDLMSGSGSLRDSTPLRNAAPSRKSRRPFKWHGHIGGQSLGRGIGQQSDGRLL